MGRELGADEHPRLQLSLILIGSPDNTLDVDTYVFGRDNNDAVKALFDNDKAAFKAHRLNGSAVEPLIDSVVRANVEHAATDYELFAGDFKCIRSGLSMDARCVATERAQKLAGTILQLQGSPLARPITSRHTDLAPGGVVAILAPKAQLDALAKLKPVPSLQLWVHDAEHPELPTLRFRNVATKAPEPIQFQVSEMITTSKCFPTAKSYGAMCFSWVPLRLESIAQIPEK